MCGRFTLTVSQLPNVAKLLDAWMDPESAKAFRPRYNIAPSTSHFIFTGAPEGVRLEPARWGLIPHWSKGEEGWINARIETAAEKPAFRDAFRKRRCVVPADGFYEWTGPKSARQPYWFHRPKKEVFLFAGLYEPADEAKKRPETFTILTAPAEGMIKPYHERMPVIISPEIAKSWIGPAFSGDLSKERILELETYPVSRRVNSPKVDDPSCLDRDDS